LYKIDYLTLTTPITG